MTRLQTEPVQVHRREEQPDQFLWKGRLYVIHEVLSRWTESGGWWSGTALRALTAGEPALAQQSAGAGLQLAVDDNECEWWRVEAGCGRFAGTGVYDLSQSVAHGTWSLSRVLD